MSQLTWNTSAGNIGAYIENKAMSFSFSATKGNSSNTLKYVLLNGVLPAGLTLSQSGVLSGTPITTNTTYTTSFTVRVTELSSATVIAIKDRTFSLTISSESVPRFTSTNSNLGSYNDSVWTVIDLPYINPLENTTVTIEFIDGELPDGLELIDSALKGYPSAQYTANGSPTSKTYEFVLKISNGEQFSTAAFSITIINQETIAGFVGRTPAIFNVNHPTATISKTDEYYSYYLSSDSMGTFAQGTQFKFKILGHDFDTVSTTPLIYSATIMSGVATILCDADSGWITLLLPTIGDNLTTVVISVSVSKGSLISAPLSLNFKIQGNINPEVIWSTESNLEIISNTEISRASVLAKSTANEPLTYTLISGTLPPGLSLLSTGEISGRVAFETLSTTQNINNKTVYTFTVRAQNADYSFISSTKTFNLTVNYTYSTPYDNLYIQAFVTEKQRELYDDLITNDQIFPDEYIYRLSDPYYGKASKILFHHLFGVPSSVTNDYVTAANRNHYKRNVVLGELKTAVAKDSTGKVIYEVVYSKVIDDLINDNNTSVSKELLWPEKINNTVTVVYPASLVNMRKQIVAQLGSINKNEILPLWMRSVQPDGNTLGFVSAFVICYTNPGRSETIKNNINTMWQYKLHDIHFAVDRFIVDRSFTYQFDPTTDTWSIRPSAVSSSDVNDSTVSLKKTILS
jgi:hypothetical protein